MSKGIDWFTLNLEVKYIALIATLLSTGITLGTYLYATPLPQLSVSLAIIGANIALATLVYNAMSLHSVIENNKTIISNSQKQHEDLIALEKKKHSFELISIWQSPEMVKMAVKGYKMRKCINDMDGTQIAKFLEENQDHQESLVCICNFFENMAHLIKHEAVDEDMLKDYFSDLLKTYFHYLKGYIDYKQKEMSSNKVLREMKLLHEKWHNN
ncbi:TPA: DUF4760 domain-containing protein [Vibrio parahaemolyticus]|nr:MULTISPECIES: DUF4760 domain-containing protein [Vibrio harveyi group]UPR37716.1 DUF4760 domain-containing protein [Vibrio parahaemolyticus]